MGNKMYAPKFAQGDCDWDQFWMRSGIPACKGEIEIMGSYELPTEPQKSL